MRPLSARLSLLCALSAPILTLLLLACSPSASFSGQRYQGHGMAFQVGPVPGDWRRLDTNEGLLAFRDEAASATVVVNGRCGRDGDDVPLSALTQHLFMQFTEREVEEEEVMPFDGREAQRTVLLAKLDGVPKRFEAVVLKKDGCVYDFVLIAEPSTFDRARPGFDAFVAGFHTQGSR